MASLTTADLQNAKTDVDHIAALATSSSLTATDRFGNVKKTWAGKMADVDTDWAAKKAELDTTVATDVAAAIADSPSLQLPIGLQTRAEERTGDFQWIGLETLSDGAGTPMVQGNYIWATPVVADGFLKTFRVWAEATGTLKIRSSTKSGDNFTEVFSVSVTIGSTGLVELTADDFGVFPVSAGEYMGFYTAGGLVSRVSVAAPPAAGYYVQTGADDPTITAATLFRNATYQIGFEVPAGYISDPVARFAAVEALTEAAAAAALAVQTVGVTTPASGSSASVTTYVHNTPAVNDGVVTDVVIYSAVADRLTFSVYEKSGSTFTQVGEQLTFDSSVGSNTFPLNLPIASGQYVGVTIQTSGGMTYNAGSTQYYTGAISGGSFTGSLGSADLQVRYNLRVSSTTASATSMWFGKRVAFFGDSITAETSGATWPGTLCTYFGATKSLNDARSGTMMYDALDNTTSSTFNNIDAAVIAYGTNDYGNNTALGAVTDAAGSGTFYAQIKAIIEQWLTWKPSLKIIFVTPLQRTAGPNVSAGQTLISYVNAIKEVAALYACPVLDLYTQSGLNSINAASLTLDGLHPTAAGQTSHIANPAKAFFNATSP